MFVKLKNLQKAFWINIISSKYKNSLELWKCNKHINSVKKLFGKNSSRKILLLQKSSLFCLLTYDLKQVLPNPIKSVDVPKNIIVSQIEFVAGYRLWRTNQIINLYNKLWGQKAMSDFLNKFRQKLMKQFKNVLLGTSIVSVFNWEKERIPDHQLLRFSNDIEVCRRLRRRNSINKDNICEPCDTQEDSQWEPFINQEDLTVWKMEECNHKGSGLYCYKMYGRYDDVTASDYLSVFLDTVNRKKWDSHVVDLHVIESDPDNNSDVIYWETKWPKLFSNRDYVFKRRYIIDKQKKLMIIYNTSTQHPNYPVNSYKTRVTEYWSYMVIQSTSGFRNPGIEFCLTYFDNPGATLPSAISLWVSATGMPEYLKKLRRQAVELHKKRIVNDIDINDIIYDEGDDDDYSNETHQLFNENEKSKNSCFQHVQLPPVSSPAYWSSIDDDMEIVQMLIT